MVQDLLLVIAEAYILKPDGVGEPSRDILALVPDIALQGRGQLVDQRGGGFALGKIVRKRRDRADHIAGQIHKDQQDARRDAGPGKSQGHAHQKGAELRGDDLPAFPFFPLQRLVFLLKQVLGGLFRLEALDHRETGQGVLREHEKRLVLL